jgi:hypothetical protein
VKFFFGDLYETHNSFAFQSIEGQSKETMTQKLRGETKEIYHEVYPWSGRRSCSVTSEMSDYFITQFPPFPSSPFSQFPHSTLIKSSRVKGWAYWNSAGDVSRLKREFNSKRIGLPTCFDDGASICLTGMAGVSPANEREARTGLRRRAQSGRMVYPA